MTPGSASNRNGGEQTMAISIEQFAEVQLRTALVKEATRVEGTDRLLKLKISLGSEERQIVAGLGQHYEPEALVGRTIVVVANLEPATIRGVESNGMMLAASSGGRLALLTPDGGDFPPGAVVR
jgi:methionyl-tRNA synthetase